jgi:hypothetical protein
VVRRQSIGLIFTYRCGQSHAAGNQVVLGRTSLDGGHHAKLAFGDEVDEVSDLGLQIGLIFIDGGVRVGGLVLRRHCDGFSSDLDSISE